MYNLLIKRFDDILAVRRSEKNAVLAGLRRVFLTTNIVKYRNQKCTFVFSVFQRGLGDITPILGIKCQIKTNMYMMQIILDLYVKFYFCKVKN